MGIGEQDCYVCLTCKKGSIHTGVGRIGDRWDALHNKQKACREAHSTLYATFKQQWSTMRAEVVAEEKAAREAKIAATAATAAVAAGSGVAELWAKHKSNRRTAGYIQEVEERLKQLHDFDADEEEDPQPFMFDPAEAFESVIAEAMSGRKEVQLTKQKMTEMIVAHDVELAGHRREIADQKLEMDSIRKRLAAVEAELAKHTTKAPVPPSPESSAGAHGVDPRPGE